MSVFYLHCVVHFLHCKYIYNGKCLTISNVHFLHCKRLMEMIKQFCQANSKKWVTLCLSTSLAKSTIGLSWCSSDSVNLKTAVSQKCIQRFGWSSSHHGKPSVQARLAHCSIHPQAPWASRAGRNCDMYSMAIGFQGNGKTTAFK